MGSRIAAISTQIVSIPADPAPISPDGSGIRFIDNLVVHVDTEDGVRGSGLIWYPSRRLTGAPQVDDLVFVAELAAERLAREALGEDVFDVARITAKVARLLETFGTGILLTGQSAIDLAVWDARCKTLGEPLHRILGGARDTVECYSNHLLGVFDGSPEQIAAEAVRVVGEGYGTLKMPIGPLADEVAVRRVRAVRDAVGPDVRIAIDLGGGSLGRALRLGRALEEFELAWIEDPLSVERVEQYVQLRSAIATPLAAGETAYGLAPLHRLLAAGALDLMIFEPMRVGGVSGAVKLSALAEAAGVPLAAHVYPELATQLAGGLAAINLVEFVPWWAPLLVEPLEPDGGYATPSLRPGIGMDLDPAALAEFEVASPLSPSSPSSG